jgi:hypothetical protein
LAGSLRSDATSSPPRAGSRCAPRSVSDGDRRQAATGMIASDRSSATARQVEVVAKHEPTGQFISRSKYVTVFSGFNEGNAYPPADERYRPIHWLLPSPVLRSQPAPIVADVATIDNRSAIKSVQVSLWCPIAHFLMLRPGCGTCRAVRVGVPPTGSIRSGRYRFPAGHT